MDEQNTQAPESVTEATEIETQQANPETEQAQGETVELRGEAVVIDALSKIPPEIVAASLHAAVVGLDMGAEAIAQNRLHIEQLTNALENCRLYAAKRPKEEWARNILRFCADAGIGGSPLR